MNTDVKILISIIVPVYNVSKYLRRCLDSCVFQTMPDIEVVVINDCSPDPEDAIIMEEYKRNFPEKIKLSFHEKNLGLGGARNTGIKLARGKFMIFVDSDDYIDANMCKICYECAIKENSNIVLTYFYTCQIGGSITVNKRFGDLKNKNSINIYPAWAMFLRKSFIVETGILFPEKIFHEDNAVTPIWQALAKKISVVEQPLYYYIKGREGAITSLSFEARIVSIFKSYDILFEHTQKCSQNKDLMTHFYFEYITNRLKEIGSELTFQLFAAEFQKVCEKHFLRIESIDAQQKKIFDLLLKASENSNEENIYDEYLGLIRKYYLSFCSKKELSSLFSGKNPQTVCVWGCGELGTALLGIFGEMDYECLVTDMNKNKIGKIMPNGSIVKPWNEVKDKVKILIVGIAGKCAEISNMVDKDIEIYAVNG
jgi:glycosyltransferase involved in cell wall biosynthesis